jgi:hypothetical protein
MCVNYSKDDFRAKRSTGAGLEADCRRLLLEKSDPARTYPLIAARSSWPLTCELLSAETIHIDENVVPRLRICGHKDCPTVFTICVRCDRPSNTVVRNAVRKCGGDPSGCTTSPTAGHLPMHDLRSTQPPGCRARQWRPFAGLTQSGCPPAIPVGTPFRELRFSMIANT